MKKYLVRIIRNPRFWFSTPILLFLFLLMLPFYLVAEFFYRLSMFSAWLANTIIIVNDRPPKFLKRFFKWVKEGYK